MIARDASFLKPKSTAKFKTGSLQQGTKLYTLYRKNVQFVTNIQPHLKSDTR